MINQIALWLIAAAVLLVMELLSGAVVALCLAIGCLAAVIPAAFDLPVSIQIVVAIIAALLALFFLGPVIRKLYARNRSSRNTASNMDALIGRIGKVTAPVTAHFDDNGRVRIDGDSWLAYTTDPDTPLLPGSQVVVEAYDSLVLKVKPLKNKENA